MLGKIKETPFKVYHATNIRPYSSITAIINSNHNRQSQLQRRQSIIDVVAFPLLPLWLLPAVSKPPAFLNEITAFREWIWFATFVSRCWRVLCSLSQEKPHKCSLCSKSFPTPGDLKSHMYVHNGSWPFKCDICNRGFSKQTNLRNHMLLHSGESERLAHYFFAFPH